MGGFASSLLTFLVGPAIVAALITFFLNTKDERRRNFRDNVTSSFDETRKDIREAVSAGVAYFGCTNPAKLPELEAQVLLYESDVRSGMAAIRSLCEEADLQAVPALITLEGQFLDALTGGDFGSLRSSDPDRARRIIGLGSRLRSDLAKLRRHQLRAEDPSAGRMTGLFIMFLFTCGFAFVAGFYDGWVLNDHQISQPKVVHSKPASLGAE
jgi:hypothetical protein